MDAFQAAFGPHGREILDDIPSYTDLEPIVQISEVVVEQPRASDTLARAAHFRSNRRPE